MRFTAVPILLIAISLLSACGSQPTATSETPRPTQTPLVRATEQIDPADVINVEVVEPGETLAVNKSSEKPTLNCDKYNRVTINGDDNEVTITGVCSQIMINGRRNQITAVAAVEIVAFGQENTVKYSKYANGKKPTVTDTSKTNTITKVGASEAPAPKK